MRQNELQHVYQTIEALSRQVNKRIDRLGEPEPEQCHLTDDEITEAYDQTGDTSLEGLYGVVIAAFEAVLREEEFSHSPALSLIFRKHLEAYQKDLSNE